MRSYRKYSRLLLLLLAILGLLAGCDGGEPPVQVEFNKTVPLTRPQNHTISEETPVLRVAVGAMISPRKTFSYYQDLFAYLQERLGRRVVLVQKKTYAETNQMLGNGEIDLAFICSGPYAVHGKELGLKLLAAPQVGGSTRYHSYLIVHRDSAIGSMADLTGRTFAFTDPDSNTGWLVPRYWLSQIGQTPGSFFGAFLFTYGHDNSILAVAKKMVDAASVDSLIYDYHQAYHPALTAHTRILRKSEPFGIPPIVGSPKLLAKDELAIKEHLFVMHEDPRGREILNKLNIDRFVPAKDEWYRGIRKMELALQNGRGES